MNATAAVCSFRHAVTEYARTGICDALLEAHVARCPACAEWLDSQRALQAALQRLRVNAARPRADIESAVLTAFRTQKRIRVRQRAAIAAALLVAGILGAGAIGKRYAAVRPESPPIPRAVAELAPPKPASVTPSVTLAARPSVRPKPVSPPALPANEAEPFTAIPYTLPLAEGERAWVVRMELPAAALLSTGVLLSAGAMDEGPLEADVVIGEDGRARAIRLVSAARFP